MRPEKLYLTDIIEAADAIKRFIFDISYDIFTQDEIRQSAVLQKLMIIGEAATHLPDEFRHKYDQIPWVDIIGFRNFAIHEYFSVNWKIVWITATVDVPNLKEQIVNILPFFS